MLDNQEQPSRPEAKIAVAGGPPVAPAELDKLQRETFGYFLKEANPSNGLIADKTQPGAPSSIAAVGLALSSYPVGVVRGFMSRADAVQRTLATLRFFDASVQGTEADATGYKGFYYHFLDMKSGKRVWECELSTVDTAFLLAGMLTAAAFFLDDTDDEREIRELADKLYRRADWQWAQNGGVTVSRAGGPRADFFPIAGKATTRRCFSISSGWARRLIRCRRRVMPSGRRPISGGASTATSCCIPGLSSRTRSRISGSTCEDFATSTCVARTATTSRTVVARPMSSSATRSTIRADSATTAKPAGGSPRVTARGPTSSRSAASSGRFFDYLARGVPDGPDDGTIAPWAVVASLPFAPEIVLPTLDYFINHVDLKTEDRCGFKATFNPTHPDRSENPFGWVSPWQFGLNQGPIVLMIENYRSGLPWRLMRSSPYAMCGLRRAGFTGGWLDGPDGARPERKQP